MRLLAVDWGAKRIGIAVGEVETAVATPRKNLAASGKLESDARAIADLAAREEADAVLVGVPVNPYARNPMPASASAKPKFEDASERDGRRIERLCRRLGEHLRGLGVTVLFQDETLSSVEAENLLFETGYKASERDRMRDGAAAATLLNRHFRSLRTDGFQDVASQGDGIA